MRVSLLCLFLVSTVASHGADQICVRHLPVPGYPRLARMARLQGSVSVELEIGADGKVLSAKGSGAHRLLARASEENIRQWSFGAVPGGAASVPARRHRVIYVYKLEGKEECYDSPPIVVLDLPDRIQVTGHPPEPQP